MNDSEYTAGVFSVKSDSFAPNNVDPFEFRRAIVEFIAAANKLNLAKKALFYPGASSFGESSDPKALFNFKAFEEFGRVDTLHAILGIMTEAGELGERLIKLDEMDRNNVEESKASYTNMFEEYGDIFWYLYLGVADLGNTPAEVRAANIRKLRTRYPDKFSGGSALRRNVEAELRALSSDPKDSPTG